MPITKPLHHCNYHGCSHRVTCGHMVTRKSNVANSNVVTATNEDDYGDGGGDDDDEDDDSDENGEHDESDGDE